MKNSSINKLVNKILNETLEEKADKLVNKLKNKEVSEDMGGMEDEHPTFGRMTPEDLRQYTEELLKKYNLEPENNKDDKDFPNLEPENNEDDEDFPQFVEAFESDFEEGEMCSECSGTGMMNEVECSECGGSGKMYQEEGLYDVAKKFPEKQSFDYVQETDYVDLEDPEEPKKPEDSKKNYNPETCDYAKTRFGLNDELTQKYCIGFNIPKLGLDKHMFSMNESSKVKQMKSKTKVTKKPDFLDLDNDGDKEEPMKSAAKNAKNKKTQTDEGNAFTKKLKDTPKGGTFELGGKKYKDNSELEEKDCMECGSKYPVKESIKLKESQLIELVQNIIEQEKKESTKTKSNIKTSGNVPGLKKYEQSFKASGKENADYLKSLEKKMKDYLKDGSKGKYEMNPDIFPKGNGELTKMNKKAYIPSDAVKDYTDNFTAAGLENLDYDEIHPNEDWVESNVVGSSKTGNNPEWANTGKSDVNKKRNEIRKKNMLAKIKRKAYNKAPQPIVNDKTGDDEGSKLMMKLESKESQKLNEEFNRMTNLISYNKKTQ